MDHWASTRTLVIDTTAPVVANVTSTSANGLYRTGAGLGQYQVEFSEPVYVTGFPRLEIETGATDRKPSYSSGSGTNTLTFGYTVQTGDISPDLDCTGTGALTLNGGTMRDAAGNDASLALPAPGSPGSLGYNKNIVVDGVKPTVVDVTSTKPDGAYKAGVAIDITVTYSEPVNVTGIPLLDLETGAVDQKASYLSGSGGAALAFRYTVQPGDTSADLGYKATNSLTGTIKDLAGNAAWLTLAAPGSPGSLNYNKALVIDTTAPVSTANPAGGRLQRDKERCAER